MQGNTVDYSNYFFIDWGLNGQNVAGNYSNIGWAAYWHFQGNDRQLDNGYANVGDVTRWSNGGRIYNYAGNFTTRDLLLASGSFDIGHNTDGTKTLNVAGGVTGYSGQRSEGGGSWALPTIPRYATITGHSGTITDEATSVYISYSNPYGGSVQADLYVRPLGSTGGFTNFATRSGYASGANFNLTTAERNAARAALAGATQGQMIYRVTNGVGNTDVGWSNETLMNIINANPVFDVSNISYLDTNSTIVAITTNNQKIVQNQSTLQGAFTPATGLKYATITNYKVTLGTDVRNFSTAQAAIAYGAQNLSVDTPLTIEVTDSRGNKTTAAKTVTVLPWSLPSAVVSIKRVNNYENNTKVKADVTISSVDSKNATQVLKVRYKKTTVGTWNETNLTSGTEATIVLDKLFEWNIEIVITDKFGTTTYTALVQRGTPIMFLDNVKLSVGIGMFPTGTETLEVADQYLIPIMKKAFAVGDIIMTTNSANPGTRPHFAGTTWAAWGSGRVPVGMGSNGTNTYSTVDATGGSDNNTHNHWTSVSFDGSGLYVRTAANGQPRTRVLEASHMAPYGAGNVGGNLREDSTFDETIDVRSAYQTCYFWKRTA